MPRYFLSDKPYEEVINRTSSYEFTYCKLLGNIEFDIDYTVSGTLVMHTKQNTSGTLSFLDISDKCYVIWTTPIFYPNSTGQTNLELSIEHASPDSNFEIKAVAFSVVATGEDQGCDCFTTLMSPDGSAQYDPFNQSFDPTGIDFSSFNGQTLDSINVFNWDEGLGTGLYVDCCDAVIGICVEYTRAAGRGSGDITINTDVDDSYVQTELEHNQEGNCEPYKLRNPFQHFIRQNDRVAGGFSRPLSNSVSLTERTFLTNNNVLNTSTSSIDISSIFFIDATLPAEGSNIIDHTNLFFLFDAEQAFVKEIIITNLAGTQTITYNGSVPSAQQTGSNPDTFLMNISYVSGSITYTNGGDPLTIKLIF